MSDKPVDFFAQLDALRAASEPVVENYFSEEEAKRERERELEEAKYELEREVEEILLFILQETGGTRWTKGDQDRIYFAGWEGRNLAKFAKWVEAETGCNVTTPQALNALLDTRSMGPRHASHFDVKKWVWNVTILTHDAAAMRAWGEALEKLSRTYALNMR